MITLFPVGRIFTTVRGWALLFLYFDVACWTLLLLKPVGHVELVALDDIFQCLGPLLDVPLCLGRLRPPRLRPPRLRTPLLLGLGLLAYVVGQGI